MTHQYRSRAHVPRPPASAIRTLVGGVGAASGPSTERGVLRPLVPVASLTETIVGGAAAKHPTAGAAAAPGGQRPLGDVVTPRWPSRSVMETPRVTAPSPDTLERARRSPPAERRAHAGEPVPPRPALAEPAAPTLRSRDESLSPETVPSAIESSPKPHVREGHDPAPFTVAPEALQPARPVRPPRAKRSLAMPSGAPPVGRWSALSLSTLLAAAFAAAAALIKIAVAAKLRGVLQRRDDLRLTPPPLARSSRREPG